MEISDKVSEKYLWKDAGSLKKGLDSTPVKLYRNATCKLTIHHIISKENTRLQAGWQLNDEKVVRYVLQNR